jgi:hypothetical protein
MLELDGGRATCRVRINMKLLLGENLPYRLRLELGDHEVFTVAFMGWRGVEDDQLLEIAARFGFDAVLTDDRGLEYQQDDLPVSVVVLRAPSNAFEDLQPLIPQLLTALDDLQPQSLVRI